MKKKGFTLVELLAVILILSIVALVATPIVLNVIDDAKYQAGLTDANNIYKGITNYCLSSKSEALLYPKDPAKKDICADGVTVGEASSMVNLGKAKIISIAYTGGKVTGLVVESNGYRYTLNEDGTFLAQKAGEGGNYVFNLSDVIKIDMGNGNTYYWEVINKTDEKYTLMMVDPLFEGAIYDETDKTYDKRAMEILTKLSELGFDMDTYDASGEDEMSQMIAQTLEATLQLLESGMIPDEYYPSVLNKLNEETSGWKMPNYEYTYNNVTKDPASYKSIVSKNGITKITLNSNKEVNVSGDTKARMLTLTDIINWERASLIATNGNADAMNEETLKSTINFLLQQQAGSIASTLGITIDENMYNILNDLRNVDCGDNNYNCSLMKKVASHDIQVGDIITINLYGDVTKFNSLVSESNVSTEEYLKYGAFLGVVMSLGQDAVTVLPALYTIFPDIFNADYNYESLYAISSLLIYTLSSETGFVAEENLTGMATFPSNITTYNNYGLATYVQTPLLQQTGIHPVIEIPTNIVNGEIDGYGIKIDGNTTDLVTAIKKNNVIYSDDKVGSSSTSQYIIKYETIDSYVLDESTYYYYGMYTADLNDGKLYVYGFNDGVNDNVKEYGAGSVSMLETGFVGNHPQYLGKHGNNIYFQKEDATVESSSNTNPVFRYISTNKDGTVKVEKMTITGSESSESGKGTIYRDKDTNTIYFRGKNNNIRINGQLWKIISINPDNSVRVILDGTIGQSKFNESSNSNAYVGYMYGNTNSSIYGDTHKNTNSSTVKTMLDNWYESKILGSKIESYIVDAGFCGDRRVNISPNATLKDLLGTHYALHSDSTVNDTGLGYSTNATAYGMAFRLNENHTHTCNKEDLYTVSNEAGNKALKYPIGLITGDEMLYAGANVNYTNNNYYLFLQGQPFWTMTPMVYDNGAYMVTGDYGLSYDLADTEYYVRPVINIKGDISVRGNGTASNPYTIVEK